MMPLSNGMIPTMSNQNSLGNSPMVPLSMQHSGQLNPLQGAHTQISSLQQASIHHSADLACLLCPSPPSDCAYLADGIHNLLC